MRKLRGVAQPGSARRSGRRGRGFKSRHPDKHKMIHHRKVNGFIF